MENSNPQYTCISCAIAFITADDQRGHYKSDHHRYNMKRRVAGLPPVTAHAFNEKVLERRAETALTTSATGKTCRICRKVYTTENAYRSHIASKKHRDAEAAQGPTTESHPTPSKTENAQKPPPLQPVAKLVTDDPGTCDTSIEARISASRNRIPPTTCLFCALSSESIEANVTHMTRQHGFFIPDTEYLLDLPGLLTYLGDKIAVSNVCIWCNGRGRAFHSLDAVRKHMLDKSHCKIAYDSQDDRLDVSDYYDFTSSYAVPSSGTTPTPHAMLGRKRSPANENDDEQWEDDETVPEEEVDEIVEEGNEGDEDIPDGARVAYGDTPYELVLPSGARIGHRSLKRYYVQKFSDPLPNVSGFENSDSVVVRRLLKESRTGLIPASGGGFGGSGRGMMTIKANSIHQAKEAGRHIKEHRDARVKDQFRIKAGFKANHQKHYRDQLLQ
ncbi:hypothetical protein M407DRAFT_19641 [Tulasnella calospora MUT 4182]|uniref:C2H2-type domain-containing protein n=1 Tax=Tulasnella calospora MUT 4182 TaxID=1051891 RepID=A0A0C3MBY5_9AGAM|nr:hypothetical protein M407DRAFT_19641 [Tulasnella calospora MUT 4182]